MVKSFPQKGRPLIYIDDGAVDALPGLGLDEEYDGHPLRDDVRSGGGTHLISYTSSRLLTNRRLILVSDISALSWPVQLAALITGARVQEHLLKPLLQYEPVQSCTLAFTSEFAKKHCLVVAMAKDASQRPVCEGTRPQVKVLKVKEFLAQAPKLKTRVGRPSARTWSLLYDQKSDAQLSNLTTQQASLARTFVEFSRHVGVTRLVHS